MAENQERAPRIRPVVRGEGPYHLNYFDGENIRVNQYMTIGALLHDIALEIAKPGARLSLENWKAQESSDD